MAAHNPDTNRVILRMALQKLVHRLLLCVIAGLGEVRRMREMRRSILRRWRGRARRTRGTRRTRWRGRIVRRWGELRRLGPILLRGTRERVRRLGPVLAISTREG